MADPGKRPAGTVPRRGRLRQPEPAGRPAAGAISLTVRLSSQTPRTWKVRDPFALAARVAVVAKGLAVFN
ncbi:protein of unknown function [Denitratisoma oestradiolicum]|uniref:Uncharacterized protein n=1 Tax=Denitratisoma oestradiolicum TaxID=311182 RepID=A0A6S6XQN9_9PROT|nr:protein of unknown function [Denitratisoma oestradiolicum]